MSTFFKKLFKPKWQSSNAGTRKAIISELSPSKDEDKRILIQLAKDDADNQVRRAAINKIEDINTLLDLHSNQTSALKPAIIDRLEMLAKSNSLPIYDLISDSALLTDLIINTANAEQYIGALPKLSPEALSSIAVSAKINQIRQSAVELVVDTKQLVSIEKQAKGKDKKVYQLAKSKLKVIKENKKQQEAIIQKKETIIKALKAHSKTETIQLYEAKLTSLLAAWNELDPTTESELQQQFNQAKSACEIKSNQHKEEQESLKLAEQQAKQKNDERIGTLEILEQTSERLKHTPIELASELSALDAIIKTQDTRWIEATRSATVEKAEQKQYQEKMGELKRYLKASQHFISKQSEFADCQNEETNTSQDSAHLQSIKAFTKQIAWPDNFEQPALLKALFKLSKSAPVQKEQTTQDASKLKSQINEQLSQLEEHLNNRALKPTSRLFKDLNHLLHSIDKNIAQTYQGKLQLLGKQLDELRDWHGFAVTPKQTELCEHMERLAEQHSDPAEKALKIKELQDEWKKLGGSSDQSIWLRFKSACDKAYEPCHEYFDQQKSLKKSNVEKRKTICNQVSDFVANNDWDNADWKAVEKINRTAREEWKGCYPVEFKNNKSIQKTFNELLAKIDQHLEQERSKNKLLKQNIVERALAFITHEPLTEAVEGSKQLQSEWQKIGITLHKDDRNLWKEYRAACDQIFQRRDIAKVDKQKVVDNAIAQAEALCNEASSYNNNADSITNKQLSELIQKFKAISPLPKKEQERLSRQLDQHISGIKLTLSQKAVEEERLRWLDIERKSKLIRDVAEKVKTGSEEVNFELVEADITPHSDQVNKIEEALQKCWSQIKGGESLESLAISTEDAKTLCIQCEIAAEIDSPDEDKNARMQLQVSRLANGLNKQRESVSKKVELDNYLEQWFKVCLLPAEVRLNLEERVNKVITKIA
jgi:DNA repair protein SbcC/Rad50